MDRVVSADALVLAFGPEDIAPFQSAYIQSGRRSEGYCIQAARVQGDVLTASFDMVNPYVSALDRGRFHLSIFTAQEVCVELSVFWMHQRLGLRRKSGEAWMRECSCRIRHPIRAVRDLQVAMTSEQFRVVRGTAYLRVACQITDRHGGLFLLEQRGGLQGVSGDEL